MLFRELRVQNWCQFLTGDQPQVFPFEPGLNGLFGRNGVGKSNLLHALRFALTGDADLPGVLADNVSRGIGPKEAAYVQLLFEHQHRTYTLHRGLQPRCQWLQPEGEAQRLTKNEEINEFLGRIGLAPAALEHYLMVPQGQVAAWLRWTPAKRQAWFAELCGLDRYEDLAELLAQQHRTQQAAWLVQGESAERQLQTLENDLRLLLEQQAAQRQRELELTPHLLAPEQEKTQRRLLAQALSVEELRRRREEHAMFSRQLDLAVAQRTDVQSQLQRAEAAWETERPQLEKIRAQLAAQKQAKEIDKLRSQTEHELHESHRCLAEATAPPEPNPDDQLTQAEQQELDKLQAEVQTLGRLVQSLSGRFANTERPAACPVCGQQVSPAHLKELRTRANKAQQQAKELKQRQTRWQDAEHARDAHWAHVATLKANIAGIESRLAALPATTGMTPVEEKRLQRRLVAGKTVEERVALLRTDHERLGRVVAELDGKVQLLKKQLANKEEVELSAEERQQLQAALTQHDAAAAQIQRLQGSLELLQRSVAETQKRLAAVRATRQGAKAQEDWVERLGKLRAFFHRSGAPRECILGLLGNLQQTINGRLAWFDTPFTVTIDESLQFRAEKRGDEKPEDAARLSGGERTLLGILFWLSVPSPLGVLVLDEPTEYVDDVNVHALRGVFERLQTLLVDEETQLLVVTHELDLAPVFNHALQLEN